MCESMKEQIQEVVVELTKEARKIQIIKISNLNDFETGGLLLETKKLDW